MNSNEQHPSLTLPIRKAELIVHPNSGFDVFEKKFDDLAKEQQDKFDDLENRLNTLIDSLGRAGLPTREGMLQYSPSQFFKAQQNSGKGYYPVPFDCYLEMDVNEADSCMALWCNFPTNDPQAWYNAKRKEYQNANNWTVANRKLVYMEMMKYMICNYNVSYRYQTATFLHKGDRLLLTAAYHHDWAPFVDARIQDGYGDSQSFIRLLPIIK